MVKPRNLKEGLVLKQILPLKTDPLDKFKNYQGLYLVSKLSCSGALILSEMDWGVFPEPFHSDSVKKYFV